MAITSVMGVTTYSTVMNVADTSITSVMGVAQGGGGGATLLEGFEGTPLTGDLVWANPLSATVSDSTSHVTQGSFSWQVSQTAAGFYALLGHGAAYGNSDIDLTGFTSILLDVYVDSIGASDVVWLTVNDATATQFQQSTTAGVTGATTIILDISGSSDLSSCAIVVLGAGNAFGGLGADIDFYIDNLRAS